MTDENEYAIGHADSIGVVVADGVWSIEYDLKQAQDDGFALFDIPELERDQYYRTDDLSIGKNVSVAVAKAAESELVSIYGFVVPDHLLGSFIEAFPEMEVYRR